MSLGITLHFQPSSSGHWCQLYIVDIEGHCPSCGWAEVKRYYRDTPFHSLTVRKLDSLGELAPTHFSATCEQCGSNVGPTDVQRHTLHYGFADGTGLIQRFATGSKLQWQLSPRRHLDSQQILQWEPEDNIASMIVDRINERTIHSVFGRVLSPKEALRTIVRSADTGTRRLSHGLEVTYPVAPFNISTESPTTAAWQFPESETLGAPLPGHAWEWFSDLFGSPDGFDSHAMVVIDIAQISTALRKAVGQFPMDTTITEDEDSITVTTDDEVLTFIKSDIAREAALTLSEPGDIAHMELDRAIHALSWDQPE